MIRKYLLYRRRRCMQRTRKRVVKLKLIEVLVSAEI